MDNQEKPNGLKQISDDKKKVGLEALKGFTTGGATGAITGGVKGALKTKTGKKTITLIIGVLLIAGIVVGMVGYTLFVSMIGQETEASTSNARASMSLATMNKSVGADNGDDVKTVMTASQEVEWELTVAIWNLQRQASGGVGDYQVTNKAIEDKKISKTDAENLESSTRFISRELARHLRDNSTKGVATLDAGLMESANAKGEWVRSVGNDDRSKESAEYAKKAITKSVSALPLSGVKDRADEIYRVALGWRTGDSGAPSPDNNAPVCTPGDGSDGTVHIPEKYRSLVEEASKISGLSVNLHASQIQAESSWNPNASSGVAFGIVQFKMETWAEYGNGGDIWNPTDAIPALGRYMKFIKDKMEPLAKGDEELLARMTLFGYHNGPYAISNNGNDFEKALSVSPRGKAYVEKIMAGSKGTYTADCKEDEGGGSQVAEGTITETAGKLAWDQYVEMPYTSMAYAYGKDKARPEFVEAASKLSKDWHTAYFTDCGVFVSTVMRTSGADPTFPKRSTPVMLNYVRNSEKYDTFIPKSEADLKAGDVLVLNGHIYLYTGKRNASDTGRAQGASLSARPPAGHYVYLSDRRGQYTVARLKNQD
ncbi:transglycosylase SLT domain-containing protein [Glutamicibacter sp. 363]|uniref:transglycosylase SLT domain-containing protein n=1 Tax=Glutamicibacter sp. 363 TaxID=3457731 RepID=UPI0040336CAB